MEDIELLLTILSVLAAWGFLTVLIVGLLLILKVLDSVREHLQKIAMGVRAIEQETLPLASHTEALVSTLDSSGAAGDAAADRLASVADNLEAAGPALRRDSTSR